MKYKVRISELCYGEMDVEAHSEGEAMAFARKNFGNFIWVDSETTDMIVEEMSGKPTEIVPEKKSEGPAQSDTQEYYDVHELLAPDMVLRFGSCLDSDLEVLAHLTNSAGIVKGRVASAIFGKYPEIVPFYKNACQNQTPPTCQLLHTKDNLYVANLFGHGGHDSGWKIDYTALENALQNLANMMTANHLESVAFPYGMGCGLAGGDWDTVLSLLKKTFEGKDILVEIWKPESKKESGVCKDSKGECRCSGGCMAKLQSAAQRSQEKMPGYHQDEIREPLIWEHEDWSADEWKVLCKICGLPAEKTERIVLRASEVEYFVAEDSEEALEKETGDNRTHIVTEFCPNCETEIEMRWNTDVLGFKAYCPVCGKRLMLCDACRHTDQPHECDYDSFSDTCRYNCF